MKYILPFLLLFFIGCEKKEEKQPIKEINLTQKKETNITEVEGLTFINNKLKIAQKKIFLICKEIDNKCQEEVNIMNKLKIDYALTTNEFLINYFKIKTFPTIIIVDKNITKYEGFTPYEILKAEGL